LTSARFSRSKAIATKDLTLFDAERRGDLETRGFVHHRVSVAVAADRLRPHAP